MTVAELIEELKKYPQDAKVTIYTSKEPWNENCSYQDMSNKHIYYDASLNDLDFGSRNDD